MAHSGKKIFSLLAAALEHPSERIVDQLNASLDVLKFGNWEAELHLARFRDACLAMPLADLERIYTATFSSEASCSPCVGHHLFDHDRSRDLFAAKLRDEYLGHVASPEKREAPDHIAVVLRSLVVQESVEEARELMACCLIPAAGKMLGLLDDRNPYRHVLRAVLLTLRSEESFTGSHRYASVH